MCFRRLRNGEPDLADGKSHGSTAGFIDGNACGKRTLCDAEVVVSKAPPFREVLLPSMTFGNWRPAFMMALISATLLENCQGHRNVHLSDTSPSK